MEDYGSQRSNNTYGVIPALKAGNKKQALQELSARAAKLTGIDEHEIFNILLQRERLGSTASATASPFRMAR